MVDIEAALTRKLGPLPAWGWGGALGVGVLAYRALHGGGAAGQSGSSGTVQTIGGDGASFDPSSIGSSGGGSGGSSGGTPVPDPVGGPTLPGVIGQVSSAFTLQSQLNDALQKLTGLMTQRAQIQTNINTTYDAINKLQDQYNAGSISKTTYSSKLATYQKTITTEKAQYSTLTTQITSAQTLIAGLKKKLAAIFAAPAAS
jgi:hypothetical protein